MKLYLYIPLAASGPQTQFWRLPRKRAGTILLILIPIIAACWHLGRLANVRDIDETLMQRCDQFDINLYSEVIARIRAGEGYYEVLGGELRRRNYGTRSIFNWRTPLHLWSLGQLPGSVWPRALLILVAVAAVTMSFLGMERDAGFLVAIVHAVILAPTLALFSHGYLFPEVWAGTLIVLSVGFAACGRHRASVVAGLIALFVRELALPYAVVALGLAQRAGRRGERLAWALGLVVYTGYFAVHAARVSWRITDLDLAYQTGWLRWGGPSFVYQTAIAGPLALLPTGIAAIYIALAMLGMIGWQRPLALRVFLTTASYAMLFSVAGKSFNSYWGLMYSPLLAFGFAWAPAALRDLARSIVGRGPHGRNGSEIDVAGV